MGFFKKLINWFTGKGFKEEEIKQPPPQPEVEPTAKAPDELPEIDEEETQQKIVPVEDLPKKEQEEFKKAIDRYKTSPSKQDVQKKIDGTKVNKVSLKELADLGHLRPQYVDLLTNNAKLSDPDILNILIANRAQLQHRFSITFIVFLDGKRGGELEMNGLLLEHSNLFYEHINVGDSVEYLSRLLAEVGEDLKTAYGAIGGRVKPFMEKGKVTDIVVDATFA